MRGKGWVMTIVLVSLFWAGTTSFASTITKDFEETYDFRPGGDVSVKSVNGGIEVTPWNKDAVQIKAEIKVKANSRQKAKDLLEDVEIVIDHDSDRVRVEADYPRHSKGGGFFGWIFGSNGSVSVRYWIKVPEKVNIDLRSTNGGIRADNIEGRAELKTTNGGIEASEMRGTVHAHTTNGSIRMKAGSFGDEDEIILKTTNGSIRLTLPSDVSADITANTVNGSISTDFPITVQGKLTKRYLDGKINRGGGKISLGTVNGSVRLSEGSGGEK